METWLGVGLGGGVGLLKAISVLYNRSLKIVKTEESSPNILKSQEDRNPEEHSKRGYGYDQRLVKGWEARTSLFRTQYSAFIRRRVGKYVVQYSSMHTTRKRKIETKIDKGLNSEPVRVIQAFDHDKKFNFNKVHQNEIICALRETAKNGVIFLWRHENSKKYIKKPERKDKGAGSDGDTGYGYSTLLLINISPLTPAHCVIAYNVTDCMPQVLTNNSLRLGIKLIAYSNRPDSRIVFNSLGAYASQNHLHMHYITLKELGFEDNMFPVEKASLECRRGIAPGTWAVGGYPVASFRFDQVGNIVDENSIENLLNKVYTFVRVLQGRNIAHNIIILPRNLPSNETSQIRPCAVIVIPRKNQIYNIAPVCQGLPLKFAVVETAGLVLARSQQQFNSLTVQEIEKELSRNVNLEEDVFEDLQNWIRNSHGELG
ncbi:hypothetical protein AAMO2058_001190500 [Amorphochlora amoebiformis]